MNSEQIGAIAKLLWPILAFFALILLFPTIRLALKRGKIEFSHRDTKVSLDNTRHKQEDTSSEEQIAGRVANEVARNSATQHAGTLSRPLVLWVTDIPFSISHEAAELQDFGFKVVTTRSTAETIHEVTSGRQQALAVVSALGRQESGQYEKLAGLALARELQLLDVGVPLIIYTPTRSTADLMSKLELADCEPQVVTSSRTLIEALQDIRLNH